MTNIIDNNFIYSRLEPLKRVQKFLKKTPNNLKSITYKINQLFQEFITYIQNLFVKKQPHAPSPLNPIRKEIDKNMNSYIEDLSTPHTTEEEKQNIINTLSDIDPKHRATVVFFGRNKIITKSFPEENIHDYLKKIEKMVATILSPIENQAFRDRTRRDQIEYSSSLNERVILTEELSRKFGYLGIQIIDFFTQMTNQQLFIFGKLFVDHNLESLNKTLETVKEIEKTPGCLDLLIEKKDLYITPQFLEEIAKVNSLERLNYLKKEHNM